MLRLDANQEAEYVQSPTSRFQNVYKHNVTGSYYYLHPDLVDGSPNGNADDTTVILCRGCHEALLKKRKPTYSICNGFDYGYITGMPLLSHLEKIIISRYCCFGTVLKLNRYIHILPLGGVPPPKPPPRRPLVLGLTHFLIGGNQRSSSP